MTVSDWKFKNKMYYSGLDGNGLVESERDVDRSEFPLSVQQKKNLYGVPSERLQHNTL